MKIKVGVGAVLVAVITLLTTGCRETDKSQFNQTFFPTNHWKVVGQGTNGEVVVETTSTNLLAYLRVHKATPVGRLTNGQPVRVQMTLHRRSYNRGVELISSKAYPAVE